MTRKLTDHKVNPANDKLSITVVDEPGAGGACHRYIIRAGVDGPEGTPYVNCEIRFQNGPIGEAGVNGVTNEALLAILIDRMRGFQTGPFACVENGAALDALEQAMARLHQRTLNRMDRGVEGTHEK